MPFSESGCFIFVHIPKCAGTSIHSALSAHFHDYSFLGVASLAQRVYYEQDWLHHIPAARLKRAVLQASWSSYFKFTVVRNPWDRLVSLYHYFLNSFPSYPRWWLTTPIRDYWKYPLPAIRTVRDMVRHWHLRNDFARRRSNNIPFNSWVLDVLATDHCSHCRPCSEYLLDSSGNNLIDYVARFENLDLSFRPICERIGVGDLTLPVDNATERLDYRVYYTPPSVELVARRFACDI